MVGGDRDLKMKEAAAMEGGDLNLKLQSVAIGEDGDGDREDLNTKMKDAGGSEGSVGGDTMKRKPWEEEGAILKLKKEIFAAMDLWSRTQSPEKMARKDAQEKAQALGARKKKMKVVRSRFSKDFIENMGALPFNICDLSDEELAQRSPYLRKVYAAVKIYEAKNREYWGALKAQQDELGYAEDEIEVTDDEEEVAVMKN